MQRTNLDNKNLKIFEKSLLDMRNLYHKYVSDRKCGNFSVKLNFFKGGITCKNISQEEFEK